MVLYFYRCGYKRELPYPCEYIAFSQYHYKNVMVLGEMDACIRENNLFPTFLLMKIIEIFQVSNTDQRLNKF